MNRKLVLLGSAGLGVGAVSLLVPLALRKKSGRNAMILHRTIHISETPEKVYRFWSNFENWPRFIKEVTDVTQLPDGHTRWTLKGPLGLPVTWESEVTRQVPNESIAWRSLPGSLLTNSGQVKFIRNETGGTTLEIDFAYNPPAGALGEAMAKLLGADPQYRVEEIIGEMKKLIEKGGRRRALQPL
jgi:uncharacterized membrane protein